MSTAIIERTEVVAPAAPLTEDEGNALIGLAASSEKIARVRSSGLPRSSRGWSMRGDVD